MSKTFVSGGFIGASYTYPSAPIPFGIVTSGLLLNFDAGNTASYPGSGTTWTNLVSGGSNATLSGSPAFSSSNGGSIVFDGVNDYVALPSINTNASFTMEWWALRANDTTSTGILSGASGSGYLQVRMNSGNVSLVKSLVAELGNFGATTGTVAGTINQIVLTLSGSTYSCYINGSFKNTLVTSQSYTTTSPAIGTNAGSEWFTGNVYIFRQYSTVLSAADVTQNFNALRGRFGL